MLFLAAARREASSCLKVRSELLELPAPSLRRRRLHGEIPLPQPSSPRNSGGACAFRDAPAFTHLSRRRRPQIRQPRLRPRSVHCNSLVAASSAAFAALLVCFALELCKAEMGSPGSTKTT